MASPTLAPPLTTTTTDDHEVETERRGAGLLMVAIALLLLAHVGINGWHIVGQIPPPERVNWQITVPILAAFSFLHSVYLMGLRRSIAYLVLTCVITTAVEYVGVTTGVPFGRYYYTGILGGKLFGVVPWVVPLSYFMVVVPAHTIANLIVDGRPVAHGRNLPRLLLAALLTAIVMTAWDLTNDPLMANEVKAWIWTDGGPYFGIPVENFFGWTLTAFFISVICRLIEREVPAHPFAPPPRWFVAGALVAYGALMLADTLVGYPAGSRVIAPFAMGIPLLAAFMRLYEPPRQREESPT